jgi:hypothetical protein
MAPTAFGTDALTVDALTTHFRSLILEKKINLEYP